MSTPTTTTSRPTRSQVIAAAQFFLGGLFMGLAVGMMSSPANRLVAVGLAIAGVGATIAALLAFGGALDAQRSTDSEGQPS